VCCGHGARPAGIKWGLLAGPCWPRAGSGRRAPPPRRRRSVSLQPDVLDEPAAQLVHALRSPGRSCTFATLLSPRCAATCRWCRTTSPSVLAWRQLHLSSHIMRCWHASECAAARRCSAARPPLMCAQFMCSWSVVAPCAAEFFAYYYSSCHRSNSSACRRRSRAGASNPSTKHAA
jgi:hypothetical protein